MMLDNHYAIELAVDNHDAMELDNHDARELDNHMLGS